MNGIANNGFDRKLVKFWNSQISDVAAGWDQIGIYLGYIQKKNVISFTKTSAMVIIYTSIGSKNDDFEAQLVKNSKFKILGVVDHWSKTIISLVTIWHKNLY